MALMLIIISQYKLQILVAVLVVVVVENLVVFTCNHNPSERRSLHSSD